MVSLIDLSFFLLCAAIGLIFYKLYKWATKNKDYFKKRDVPALEPDLIFGNTAQFFFRKSELIDFIHSLYNHPAFENEK